MIRVYACVCVCLFYGLGVLGHVFYLLVVFVCRIVIVYVVAVLLLVDMHVCVVVLRFGCRRILVYLLFVCV